MNGTSLIRSFRRQLLTRQPSSQIVPRTSARTRDSRRLLSASSSSTTTDTVATTNNYTFAISRNVPQSFSNAVVKFSEDSEGPDFHVSQQQHDVYIDTLRRFVPTLCLPAIEEHPDCSFVEDTVVAIGNTAVITNPGHASRKGEVDSIREVLLQLGMTVVDMRDYNNNDEEGGNNDCICDGGDVMYTGRHLFVGISERTNAAAVDVLANAFDGVVETIAVPFEGDALHLKSIVTHVDSHTLLAPTGELGAAVLEAMKATERGYQSVRLPNMLACNVVAVNGGILAQDGECSESRRLLESLAESKGLKVEFLDLSEKAKADGALTCCSVLLSI
jgi:dimethylargininase